ncbi:hypothetical protein CFB84_36910 [Burkholderia aenigmatica]|uniref:Uncharacterized protein n=1 Tax=Burkholderia aenigmatica TaxID=2015348 RepID=A0A228I0N9_9BURK|nr:hypothetical protein CFB84_36910 [Burkholderia aenigmatica]
MFCSDICGVTEWNCGMGRDDHGETTGYVVRSRRCRGTPDILADRSDSCRRRAVAMTDGLTQLTDTLSVA